MRLSLTLAVVVSSSSWADQLHDIQQRGELIVGVLGSDEPQSFVDPKTHELVGYEIDLAKAVGAKLGVKVTFKQLSVAARIPELQQGRVDLLAASLTHTAARESQVDFSLTTFVTGQKVMVKVASGIDDVAQLAGKKVLTTKGGTQEPNIRKLVPTIEVVTFETTQQAFLALQQGKGVGYVNDEASLLNDYAKLGAAQKDYKLLPTRISIEPLALGLKRQEPAFKAVVNSALRDLEKSGQAEALFQKWFGPGTKPNLPSRTFHIDSDTI